MKSETPTQGSNAPRKAVRAERRRGTIQPFLDSTDTDALTHKSLALCNRRRVRPGAPGDDSSAFFNDALRELATVQLFEANLLGAARAAVGQHASEAPTDVDGLLGWLEFLRSSGPGQLDPLNDWLASEASEADVRWFVRQEVAGDRGVNELASAVATSAKVPQLRDMALLLGIELSDSPTTKALEGLTWEALARSNLSIALASSQRWRQQAVGALLAFTMTAPKRALVIEAALKRLGYEVFPLAAPYDPRIVEQVVRTELGRNPDAARGIAEGALMWMHANVRCLNRYRGELVAVDHAA